MKATSKKSAKKAKSGKLGASGKAAGTRRAARPAERAKPKIKIGVVRELAKAFEYNEDVPSQIAGLINGLDALSEAQRPVAAEVVLAHTRKGRPVARAYLQALIDLASQGASAAADQVVRFAATATRGRRYLGAALIEIWRGARDLQALEAAFLNVSPVELDHPDLLALGVAVAAQRGDTAAHVERQARLEVATRLRPIVVGLAGSGPERKRAVAKLAGLSADERGHVYRRMLSGIEDFDEATRVEALLALTDDPTIPPLVLAAAVRDLRYHGGGEIVEAWKARAAAGDAALIARVIEMFEAMAAFTTEGDALEPFIHALYPASGRPEVFAAVERALASELEVVRAVVLEEWLRETEGQRGFSDAQIDPLVRRAIAIAVAGPDDTDDRRAAGRALFYMAHPGARHALIEVARNPPRTRNDELMWNVYFGLAHIKHPDVWPALIDRMFVEDKQLWSLMEVLGDNVSPELHRLVMARLEARRDDPGAARAANVYVDILTDKKPSPREVIALGRLVAAWPARGKAAVHLRYVVEHAAAAALRSRTIAAARLCVDRLAALGNKSRSDYWEDDRSSKTPAPLAAPELKKLLAQLTSGALERELVAIRAAAATARAAGAPIRADDARLAALTGGQVDARLVTVPHTHEVWFFDDTGALQVYDGYDVAPAPCTAVLRGKQAFFGAAHVLDGCARLDERDTRLGKADHARELLRFGDRVLVCEFTDGAWGNPIGLAFSHEDVARRLFGLLRDHGAADLVAVDPWYVAGRGAIRRSYAIELDGEWPEASFAVLDATIDGRADDGFPAPPVTTFATPAAALAAFEAWESELYMRGARLRLVALDVSTTRREDTPIAQYLEQRARNDERDAAWHLRGLAEMWQAIEDAGLAALVPDIAVELGPPASADDIAAYQAVVSEPLPRALVELWSQLGSGGFATARHRYRLLSPRELVDNRDALRARHRAWINANAKHDREARLAAVEHLDVVMVVDNPALPFGRAASPGKAGLVDARPLVVFDTQQSATDGSCFAGIDAGGYTAPLGWQIAVDLASPLKDELERRLGDVFRLKLGQRPGPDTQRIRLASGDKQWEAIVDGPQLLTRTLGKRLGRPSIKRLASADAATQAYNAAIKAAKAKGFR